MYSLSDYIDRVIVTNGFIPSCAEEVGRYWEGYRIFIRDDLDKYQSVEEWTEDTGGWSDRNRHNSHGFFTEYVYQKFTSNSVDRLSNPDNLIHADYKCVDVHEDSIVPNGDKIITLLQNSNLLLIDPTDILFDVVNLHRRSLNLGELQVQDHPDISTYIDTTSRTAKIEALRVKINKLEDEGSSEVMNI
jgi:hypothetical protein